MSNNFDVENFDVRSWVNNSLRNGVQTEEGVEGVEGVEAEVGQKGTENMEAHISGLILRLQQESHGLNAKLEEEMARMLGSIPRALREVERIGRDSESLRKSLAVIEDKVHDITGLQKIDVPDDLRSRASTELEITTIDTLEHLHVIKINLDKALRVLEKTAAWDRLVQEVEASLAARDLVGVAERIGGLRTSFELLRGMPESERRGEVLHRMEQRLETLIGPGLRKAITACLESELESTSSSNSADGQGPTDGSDAEKDLHSYVSIFEKLGRLDHLCRDFAEARSGFFLEEWDLRSSNAKSDGLSLPKWISPYFEQYIASLDRERRRCEKVFGIHARSVLHKIASESLALLAPGFRKELSLLPVKDMVDVYERTCNFGETILRISNVHPDQVTTSMEGEDRDEIQLVLENLFLPFMFILDSYRDVELNAMTSTLQLESGKVTSQSVIALLGDPALIQLVEDAVLRCNKFTHGAKVGELLSAIDSFWSEFLAQSVAVFRVSFDGNEKPDSGWEERILGAVRHLQAAGSFNSRFTDFVDGRFAKLVSASCKELNERVGLDDLAQPSNWIANQLHLKAPDQGIYIRLQDSPVSTLEDIAFARTKSRLKDLVNAGQDAVYSAMLGPILREWAPIPKMKVWMIDTDADLALLNPDEESISEFGGPLKYMTRVTDHLLTLVQLLEPFSSKTVEASVLPDSQRLGEKATSKLETELNLDHGSRLNCLVTAESLATVQQDEDEEEDMDLFSPPWLSMVAVGAVNALVLEVLKIPYLGAKGSKQLAADIGCLQNAVSSVAAQDPLLLHVQNTLQMSIDEMTESVSTTELSEPSSLGSVQSILLAKRKANKPTLSPPPPAPSS